METSDALPLRFRSRSCYVRTAAHKDIVKHMKKIRKVYFILLKIGISGIFSRPGATLISACLIASRNRLEGRTLLPCVFP